MEPLTVIHWEGKFLALTANIRLGWKWLVITSALAYSISLVLNTIVECFLAQEPTLE